MQDAMEVTGKEDYVAVAWVALLVGKGRQVGDIVLVISDW